MTDIGGDPEIKTDKSCYTGVLDIYYITHGELFKKNETIIKNGIILTTAYDDVCQNLQPEPVSIQLDLVVAKSEENPYDFVASLRGNKLGRFKMRVLLQVMVIFAVLAEVVLLVFCHTLYDSQGSSSTEDYPRMTLDLCDPVIPYHDKSWYTPTQDDSLPCDVPVEISEINVDINILSDVIKRNCLSKLDCMSLFGIYYLGHNNNCKCSFFVDCNSNVYQVRGWLCPYVSGQLWVGVIVDCTKTIAIKQSKRLLQHFENDIVGYAENCDFFKGNVTRNSNM